MQAFSVRQLKSNPSTVLKAAEADAMALVTSHQKPTVLLVALDRLGLPDTAAVRSGLALSLFQAGSISVASAAQIADSGSMRVVIADTGPLIGLARIQQSHLLHNIFTTIWITKVIAAEIGLFATDTAPHEFPGSRLLAEARDRGWLRIAHSQLGQEDGDSCYIPLNPGVDPGEARV
jgi:antitoxin (DNA-binding transcriptional repressor) of toxin-antitoxin stability system